MCVACEQLRLANRENPILATDLLLDAAAELLEKLPERRTRRMLLQDSGANAAMGDRHAQMTQYRLLIVHAAQELNIFDLCTTDVPERLHKYMAHPSFAPDSLEYEIISDAPGGTL